FFSSRRRHTRFSRDWSSDVCSSDLVDGGAVGLRRPSRGGGPVAVRGDDAAGGGARVRPAGRGGAGDVRGDLVGVDLQAGGLGSRRGGRFRVVAAVRGAAGPEIGRAHV